MRAATIDNVAIGAGWVPVLDHSCAGRGGGPLLLTLDCATDSERDLHVTAEVEWSSLRGRAQVEVDIPTTLNLGASCISVRAKAEGEQKGQQASVSAQLVSTPTISPTAPTLTERLPWQQAAELRPVPRWARRLKLLSVNPFETLFAQLDLYADALGLDLLARERLIEPPVITPRARWRRFVNVDADLLLVWTLRL